MGVLRCEAGADGATNLKCTIFKIRSRTTVLNQFSVRSSIKRIIGGIMNKSKLECGGRVYVLLLGFQLIKAGSFRMGSCFPFVVTRTVLSSGLVSRTTKATRNLPVPGS